MIVKLMDEELGWHFYDDVIDFTYNKDKAKRRTYYKAMRRRGFDFEGSTIRALYLLNDEGKTIEKVN